MSFWNTSEGEKVEGNKEFESGGGDMTPIPAKTQVLAAPDEAKWDSPQDGGEDFISIRWSVLAPKEYENRKVFQKLRVLDPEAKKSDKAKRMLAAIDANAGGKLLGSDAEPTDERLTACLVNKPMMLMLQVWEMEVQGEKKTGNWVSAVSPRQQGAAQAAAAPRARAAAKPAALDNLDEDIPF
jgi:hypothetical protein